MEIPACCSSLQTTWDHWLSQASCCLLGTLFHVTWQSPRVWAWICYRSFLAGAAGVDRELWPCMALCTDPELTLRALPCLEANCNAGFYAPF